MKLGEQRPVFCAIVKGVCLWEHSQYFSLFLSGGETSTRAWGEGICTCVFSTQVLNAEGRVRPCGLWTQETSRRAVSHTCAPGLSLSDPGYVEPAFAVLSDLMLPSSSCEYPLPWDDSAMGRLLKARGLCHELEV